VKNHLILRIAGVCALIGLGFILWSFLDPPPIPVALARAAGQVLGTVAFVAFSYVIAVEAQSAGSGHGPTEPPPT
jgi:hypothetical protein